MRRVWGGGSRAEWRRFCAKMMLRTFAMLLKFRFSNFRSFRTEQELSLIASPEVDSPDGVFSPPGLGEHVLPVAAIYGANASGKTAVVKAFEFMANAVRFSHTAWQPDQRIAVEPFAGNDPAVPSEFSVDFLLSGIRRQYGFVANSQAILQEWLYVYPKGKKQVWFKRDEGGPIFFGARMPGENKAIEGFVRRNSLFLSVAAQNNHQALLPIFEWFSESISIIGHLALFGRTYRIVELTELDETDRAAVLGLLRHADLGIAELAIEELPWGELGMKVIDLVTSQLPIGFKPQEISEKRKVVRLLHRIGDRKIPFENEQESGGTLAYLALLGPIVRLLRNGGTLWVDELDTSLHPLIALEVIRMFVSPETNPRNAQLIFNTHDTNLLGSGLLRRDEIWFTEKDNSGSSHLYPLTEYKPQRQENLETGYLHGRYGAIPFINSDILTARSGGNSEKK